MHPALEILVARRSRGDRRDPYRVVLAVEGGGGRATFSGGTVMALAERGLSGAVDAVHGASAGTVNGAWFAVGDPVRGIPAWYRPGVMRRITGLSRTAVGRPVVDPLRPPWRSGDLVARGLLAVAAPGAGRAWRTRYDRVCSEEAWLDAHPDTVLTIRPPSGSPSIGQRSRSEQLLRCGVEIGRRAALAMVPPIMVEISG